MKKNLIIALLSVSMLATIAANTSPKNIICFDANSAKAYNTQGYIGYTFQLIGQPGKLMIETRNPQHKPGAILCKGAFDYTDNLNKLFPTLGC